LPSLDETASLLALHHAIQGYSFPLRYVQTDNGLEFQKRFHQKCIDLGLEHYYIHKNSPNENAVIERSFRDRPGRILLLARGATAGSRRAQCLVPEVPGDL